MKKSYVAMVIFLTGIVSCERQTIEREISLREINKDFEYLCLLDRLFPPVFSAEQNIINRKIPYTEGFIIRNRVKIMRETNQHSDVLSILNLHDKIEILGAISILQDRFFAGGWWMNWYRIRFENMEGYIRTCCADNEKHLFNINGNSIIVYPRLANGMFDDRNHNPFNLIGRLRMSSVFINSKNVVLPDITVGLILRYGKVINGNLYLIYRDFFDELSVRVIISSECRGIHISIENYDRHF